MELWTNIRVWDIIDILIVSYVIYKLIMLVRGTRAVQLLRGIFVLLIAWGLSVAFQLHTLNWLMNQAFTFGVLAIIIIFQPELRRALEQLGRGTLFSRSSNAEDTEFKTIIAEVIKALNLFLEEQDRCANRVRTRDGADGCDRIRYQAEFEYKFRTAYQYLHSEHSIA